MFSWTAPATVPLHYNLYCESLKEVIEIDAQYTSYYQEFEPGDYTFKLTAVYEDCESDFAITTNGENYLIIEIPNYQSVEDNDYEEIVNIVEIYNLNGQVLNVNNINDLSNGVYIVKGVTASGKTIIRKVCR